MALRPCIMNCVLVAFLHLSSSVLACSTAAWEGGFSGAISVNDPDNGVPSLSGRCGFQVTGAGFVQDNRPRTEDTFVGRFYFFPQVDGAGSADLFVAYSDEASIELFSVAYDGSNVILDATASGGNSVVVPVAGVRWHLVEFFWNSGSPGSLWVDADARRDAASATFNSGSGRVESVRLGAPNGLAGLTGAVYFDDYVSRRAIPVGGIVEGDGNLDGILDSGDIDAIKTRFLFRTYAEGSTDCNLDGGTNSGDVNCVVEKL